MSIAVPNVISNTAWASSRRVVSGLASCIAVQGSKWLGLELAIVSLMSHFLDAVKDSLEGSGIGFLFLREEAARIHSHR